MAKVIKIDKTKAKRVTHSFCGALIEYFPIEVQTRIITDYGGGSDTWNYLTCPHCGREVGWY